MKKLSELRNVLSFFPQEINYHLRYFAKMKLDFDVYLPTKGINLQRELVWNMHQKQEIIWSMLMKRNIPRVALVQTEDDTMQIIDGKQRLTAMIDYFSNKFPIQYEGKEYFYDDLPTDHQMQIHGHPIAGYIVHEVTKGQISDQDKINWFKFINFAGTPQDKEHLNKLS